MTQTASLNNGPKDHNNNAPSSLRKSNVSSLNEKNPPPRTVSKPPSTESSPSLGKRASPQNESNYVNLFPGYDPNNMLPYGAKLVPGKGTNTELFVKPVDGEGTGSSNPNSPPSDTGEPKEKDQPVTTVTSQQGEDNPNDSDGDGNGDEPPRRPSSSADWTDTEYRTSQEWYRKQLREKVTLVVQEFLLNIRASPPDDIRDWNVDEFVKAIETEANVFSDPSYVGDRDEVLKKRWPFLFGSSRGYTMDDVVHQEQDQSPDMLTKLDQCSESVVQYVAEDPENCYFDNPRSKYQTATPKPQFWHSDAIPDQRIRARNQYSLGNELEDGRMFWIAKMYPHHQEGRMMRGAVRHFLVENIHPRDRMTDVLTLLGNPWIVKHKAWVDSYPDQRVFENVLVKSSCLPYKHHVDGVPQNSKDAPDWATFEPDTQKLPEQDDPPKYRQILDLSEMLPSEEANQLLFSTPSVAPYLGRRRSSAQASGQSTPVLPTIPLVASSPSTNIPRDLLVLSSGVYTKPFTNEEKLIKKIEERKRQLKKLDDGFDSKKIFDFVVNFANWAKTKRDRDGPIGPFQPITKYGEPIHEFDSVRSMFYEVDPLYLSEMIEGTVMNQWKTRFGGRKEPLDRNATDHEIWEFLLFSTQYRTLSEVHAANSATKPPEISRKFAEVIWNTFIQQFVYIIRRSTAMPGTDGQPSVVYPARFILQEINKKTNNQLVNTYAIWIDEFPPGRKMLENLAMLSAI
ncbi:hypothetical protein P9112_005245 [Eukaryota sp. TZLM1-RC]